MFLCLVSNFAAPWTLLPRTVAPLASNLAMPLHACHKTKLWPNCKHKMINVARLSNFCAYRTCIAIVTFWMFSVNERTLSNAGAKCVMRVCKSVRQFSYGTFKFKFILWQHDKTLYAIYLDFVHHSSVKPQVFQMERVSRSFYPIWPLDKCTLRSSIQKQQYLWTQCNRQGNFATGWTVWGSNPGAGEIFHTCPGRLRGLPNLL
jgi:hypothetical protein